MEVSRDIQDFDFGSPTFAETSRDNLALKSEPNGKCEICVIFVAYVWKYKFSLTGFVTDKHVIKWTLSTRKGFATCNVQILFG